MADKELRKKLYRYTGFSGKTVWDWLLLLLLPIFLAVAGFWYNGRQEERNRSFNHQQDQRNQQLIQSRHNTDQQIAQDQRQDDILKSYLDNMSDLLLKYNLRDSGQNANVRNIARGQTLVAIQRLENDFKRKARILQFLHEMQLINRNNPIIPMSAAWLNGIDMRQTRSDLSNDNLAAAALNGANLSDVAMNNIDLHCAGLSMTTLSNADLTNADLRGTLLINANLSNAVLSHANLASRSCNFGQPIGILRSGANLSGANLEGAVLDGADLHGANLQGARYNTKSRQGTDSSGIPVTLKPTQWPQGFDPKAVGATCVDC